MSTEQQVTTRELMRTASAQMFMTYYNSSTRDDPDHAPMSFEEALAQVDAEYERNHQNGTDR